MPQIDPQTVKQLADFFRYHPTWIAAARPVKDGSNSEVFFAGTTQPYHLMRQNGESLLLEGPAPSPDFSFIFPPSVVADFTALGQDAEVADFAIMLFDHIQAQDEDKRVGFRVVGSITQILWRGYLQVLLKGGARVLHYAAEHGVRNLNDFSRLLRNLRGKDVDWTRFKEDHAS